MKSLLKYFLSKLDLLYFAQKLYALADKHRAIVYEMDSPTFDTELDLSPLQAGDYFRYATIALAIKRIQTEGVCGQFAEAGVYKGNTSKFIHQLAPERTCFLFDTFSGFPKQDLEPDTIEDNGFNDTSLEVVQKNLGDLKNIVFIKGYIPDTFIGLEDERFAFVHLDLDLYNPTINSLKYFYPRLTNGGYLVIHDYNSRIANQACKRAVDEFMREKPERIIEIPDRWGTILFRKLGSNTQ
jgi:O-methyltransferase